jgi:hypothetical protein
MLPTLWVDTCNMVARGDTQTATLRFYTMLPDALIESARIHTTFDHMRKLVRIFAQATDYYPTRDETTKKDV